MQTLTHPCKVQSVRPTPVLFNERHQTIRLDAVMPYHLQIALTSILAECQTADSLLRKSLYLYDKEPTALQTQFVNILKQHSALILNNEYDYVLTVADLLLLKNIIHDREVILASQVIHFASSQLRMMSDILRAIRRRLYSPIPIK